MGEAEADRALRDLVESPLNRCFVCSGTNPVGLHLRFDRRGAIVRSRFVPGEWQEGWAGVIHGGILAAVLDEAMAYTLFFRGIKAVTAKMELRYRAPVHRGDVLDVEAELTRDTRRLADVESRVLRGGQVVVEAAGRFLKLGELDPDALS